MWKKYRKKTPEAWKVKKGKPMFLSKFSVWDSENLKFIKEQEANGLLSSVEIKIPLSKNF